MTVRFQSQQRIGTDGFPSIRYGPRCWALCPADKSKRAQEVYQHLPEPLNAKQIDLYDEPPESYQSGSSRRDSPTAGLSQAQAIDPRGSQVTWPMGPPQVPTPRPCLGAEPKTSSRPGLISLPATAGGA